MVQGVADLLADCILYADAVIVQALHEVAAGGMQVKVRDVHDQRLGQKTLPDAIGLPGACRQLQLTAEARLMSPVMRTYMMSLQNSVNMCVSVEALCHYQAQTKQSRLAR